MIVTSAYGTTNEPEPVSFFYAFFFGMLLVSNGVSIDLRRAKNESTENLCATRYVWPWSTAKAFGWLVCVCVCVSVCVCTICVRKRKRTFFVLWRSRIRTKERVRRSVPYFFRFYFLCVLIWLHKTHTQRFTYACLILFSLFFLFFWGGLRREYYIFRRFYLSEFFFIGVVRIFGTHNMEFSIYIYLNRVREWNTFRIILDKWQHTALIIIKLSLFLFLTLQRKGILPKKKKHYRNDLEQNFETKRLAVLAVPFFDITIQLWNCEVSSEKATFHYDNVHFCLRFSPYWFFRGRKYWFRKIKMLNTVWNDFRNWIFDLMAQLYIAELWTINTVMLCLISILIGRTPLSTTYEHTQITICLFFSLVFICWDIY